MKRDGERDEFDVAARERAANRALYAVDPDLARELGYVPLRSAINRLTALQRSACQGARNRQAGLNSAAGRLFGVGGGFYSGA